MHGQAHAFTFSNVCLQVASNASVPTDSQPTQRQNSDGVPGSRQSSTHAQLARAQAAARLSTELQEVLRHASLAMLHLADADAITGLQQYCLHTFGGLHQLRGSGRKDGSKSSSSLSELPQKSGDGGTTGKDDVFAAVLQHPSSCVDDNVKQHQFGWLEGVALQASLLVVFSITDNQPFQRTPLKLDCCACTHAIASAHQ